MKIVLTIFFLYKIDPAFINWFAFKKTELEDGGGIGRGDHFLSYKFIERTIER